MQKIDDLTNAKPIFIVGTPRSGTTLTSRIVGRHQEIFSVRETYFFEDVWTRRQTLGALDTPESLKKGIDRFLSLYGRLGLHEMQALVDQTIRKDELIPTVLELGGGYGALYFVVMSELARQANKTLFCDDSPKHLYYFQTILNLFPNAKFIGVSRDPRDFLCSYKNYWRHSEDTDRVKALYHPISTSLLWRSAAKMMINYETEYPSNFLRVNYEAIVQNSEQEIERVCEFLDVDFSTSLLAVDRSNSSFSKDSEASGIYNSSIGRWQTCLDQEELWWSQTINKGLMPTLNYKVATAKPSVFSLMKILALFPYQLVKALHVNRAHRGPLLVFLWKRLRALMGKE